MPRLVPASSLSGHDARRGVGRGGMLLILLVLLVMLSVWQQASVDRVVVGLERAKDVNRVLETEVNALSLEANRLSSLAQVEARAGRLLLLQRPATDQIVSLQFGDEGEGPQLALGSWVPDASAGTPPEAPR